MCNNSTSAGTRWGSSFLRTITFLIIHRFLSLKVLLLYICFSRSTAYNTFQFEKSFWIWWKVLDTIILWQDAGPCCEQTHAALEVGLSLDQLQGVYSGRSDVVGSSQICLCHTCIIDVMIIGVNFHLFVICYYWLCHFPFLFFKLSVITEARLCEMCRSATASLVARMVNTNLEAQKLRLKQHRPFMSIKSFEQTQQVIRVTR